MNVGVCYAEADRQSWLRLEVPNNSTVEQAIQLSGLLSRYPEIDLSK
jgi:putative ubiquitin-RnfH superfamily antitoxin RatB of RatAB toxin-antitoxin module